MQAETNERLAEALRERRDSVEKIIRKLEELGQGAKPASVMGSPDNPANTVELILARINTFDDVLIWARRNFELSDVLLLETKFKKKLELHPDREHDPNYCRLLTLIFYLLAANQRSKVYGDLNHRALSEAFSTHLDMYHTLHLLEIVCYFARITVEIYILKAHIAEMLETQQDHPLNDAQALALAELCLIPGDGIPLVDGAPLVDLFFLPEDEVQNLAVKSAQATGRENLSTILDAINNINKGSLTLAQRHNLIVTSERQGRSIRKKAPVYSPDLGLCLQLSNLITIADMRRAASAILLEKLTRLWEILLALHIDIGAMKDFQ